MIVKELDKIIIDVKQNADGSFTYEGAVYIYQQKVVDNGKEYQIAPESVAVPPEQAVQLLGDSAGAYVAKLAEVETKFEEARVANEAAVASLNSEIESLRGQLNAENLTNQQLTAIVKAVKNIVGG